jgi:SAM-dependent methyltransferase
MPSPWLAVTAAEYEEHMGPGGADQLAPLASIFQQIYRQVRPRRLLVPGCGTGAILDHVDPDVTERAVGIDLNIQYVTVARQRYRRLGTALELYCADALHARLQPAADFDLVHVALVLEHVEPEALLRAVGEWIAPGGTCAVVTRRPGAAAPGDGAAHESLRRVAREMRLVEPGRVAEALARQGLRRAGSWEVGLRGGARLHVAVFRAPADRVAATDAGALGAGGAAA